MRWVIGALSALFVAALAVFVGWRLSSEAMAVFVGVLAGVLASVPTSLFVVWVSTRHWQAAAAYREQAPQAAPPAPPPPAPGNTGYASTSAMPPVIVVTGPGQNASPAPNWAQTAGYPQTTPHPARRQFTVIGGEGWES